MKFATADYLLLQNMTPGYARLCTVYPIYRELSRKEYGVFVMKRFRLAYLGLLFMVYVMVSLVTRLVLLHVSDAATLDGATALPRVFGTGFLNDVLPFFWLILPLAALVLLPRGRMAGKWTRRTLAALFGLFAMLFLFTATAEIIFWEEFTCRFNFIAVDYLVYTSEVLGNIMESYPVFPLLAAVGGIAAVITWLALRPLFRRVQTGEMVPGARGWLGLWMVMALLTWPFSPLGRSDNVVERELAANGVWSLFAAFQHNQLDYGQFYPSMDKEQALRTLRSELETPDAAFVLTTSNHRPFTYPDGKIDTPSGTSRSGAIKYTDYAIGRFLREAAGKPWFKDTVFVIVADHTAGSAGKTDLPPENYAIPCLIYSPGNIQPGVVDTLETFCQIWCQYEPTYVRFAKAIEPLVAAGKQNHSNVPEDCGMDFVCIRINPWIHFSSMVQAESVFGQSVPIVAWGKMVDGIIPVAIKGHHGLMDGLHCGLFFENIERSFANPDSLGWE